MRIKGYNITEQLKETEYVTVYLATQETLSRTVLLKVLKPQYSSEVALVQRLKHEAETVARINHPNVVQIYDFGREGDRVFLAMEYFPGRDFAKVIAQEVLPAVDVCLSSLRQTLAGLHAVHTEDIYHRDIKPANLLLSENGHVKITDFGLAALQGATGLTAEGSVVGTPRYMAPEQISGQSASPRSEIFSLGVTFYEICTGEAPFEAESYSAVFNKILNEDPPPVHQLRPELPESLGDMLGTMMAKDPADRYRNCRELLRELEGLPGTQRKQVSNQPRLEGESRQRTGGIRWPVIAIVMAALLIAGYFWFRPSFSQVDFSSGDTTAARLPDTSQQLIAIAEIEPPPAVREASSSIENRQPGSTSNSEESSGPVSRESLDTILTESPPPAENEAKLVIGAIPWAIIYLDGDSMGTTPMREPMTLQPGTYQMMAHHPNFPDITRQIVLESGATDTVRLDFMKESAFLSLAVYPWAEVYIDGEYIDETPIPEPLVLKPGQHLLQLRHPDYSSWQRSVMFTPGDTVSMKVKM